MGLTQVNTDGVKDDAINAGKIPDDAIGLAHLAAGTDGQVITYDASGNPVAVGPGTDGQVLTSTGAGSPPAFEDALSEGTQVKSTGESGGTKFLREDGDGTCSWQTLPSSGAALTGSTNNTVTTVTGANAIQGESKLTFDGNTLDIDNGGSPGALRIGGNVNSSGRTDDTYKLARVVTPHYHNSEEPMAIMQIASDGTNNNISYGGSWGDANAATQHRFYTAANDATTTGTEQWKIDTSGNLVAVQAGNGIDFSATSDYTNKDDEVLADYETGYFTPTCSDSITLVSTENRLWYVKIGHLVTISGSLRVNDGQSQSKLQLSGLPFSHGTIGSNGTSVSNSNFGCWGWSSTPSYVDDSRDFWATVTGTNMNLHTRQGNGDWHYFYPSDNCWILINLSYYTDS